MRVRPRRWRHSFGIRDAKGWRKDGYTQSFGPESDDERKRDHVRDVVLELAEKYWPDGKLLREVVYIDPKEREVRGGIKDVIAIVAAPARSGEYWRHT